MGKCIIAMLLKLEQLLIESQELIGFNTQFIDVKMQIKN